MILDQPAKLTTKIVHVDLGSQQFHIDRGRIVTGEAKRTCELFGAKDCNLCILSSTLEPRMTLCIQGVPGKCPCF